MKILGITQIPQQQNTYQAKQRFGYLADSFTRTSQPAFKAAPTSKVLEEAAENILGNVSSKELIKTIGMGLTALGLLIMKTANGDVKLDGEEMQTLQSFKNIFGQNIAVPAQENIETEEKTEQAVEQPTPDIAKEAISESVQSEESVIKEKTHIVFPKREKSGQLPKELKTLRETLSEKSFTEDYAEKLTAICAAIVNDGEFKINEETVTNRDIANTISDRIKNAEDNTAIEKLINEYYSVCVKSEESSQTKTIEDDKFIPVDVNLERPTVTGYVNLDSINDKRPRRTKQPIASTKTMAEVQETPVNNDAVNKTEEFVPAGEVEKQDDILYLFKLPIKNKDLYTTLKNMLIQWREFYKNDSEKEPKWLCGRQSFLKVEPQNIVWEIKNNNVPGEEYGRRKNTPYQNIEIADANEIADAINSDPRFHKFFTLHGAVRFIDRFVNIDEGHIEQQCKEKLDALEKLINKAAGTKGLMLKKYVEYDKNENELVGIRITVNPYDFGLDLVQKLGSYPITLGISENQTNHRYYDPESQEPLIHTIFPSGV